MKLSGRAFGRVSILSRPEHGDSGEDRWATCPGAGRWALCDGASSSWDAAGWAAELASALARKGPCPEAIERARQRYSRRCESPEDWLSALSRRRGSWSTALVAEFGALGLSLTLSAIGDTEGLVLDGYGIVLAFPLVSAGDFTDRPALVGEAGQGALSFHRIQVPLAGLRRPSVVLATDALAQRILAEPTATRPALLGFLDRADDAAFRAWAEAEIDAGRLAPDDLSLVWVR